MTTIYAATSDQVLVGTILPKIAQNNVNSLRLYVAFDSTWDTYPYKGAIFTTSKNAHPEERTFSGGYCFVPQSMLAEEAMLHITVTGVNAAGQRKTTTRLNVKIHEGNPTIIVSDAPPNMYQNLLMELLVERARLDNLLKNSGTVGSDEVVDARVSFDGKQYSSLGTAIRKQMSQKADKVNYAMLDYELGNINIRQDGWDYNTGLAAFDLSRVRIKEGKEVRLSTGDVIGLTDYSNARFYVGYRDLNGAYHYDGWLTSDFVCPMEADYIMLVSNSTDITQEDKNALGSLMFMKRIDYAAIDAKGQNAMIASALEVDLGFVLGSANATGFINYQSRYVTKDILCLDFDIILPRSENNRKAVHTFTDMEGNGYTDHGWVTDNGDYIITAGTPFRVLVMAADYESEKAIMIDPAKQYEHELYKSIEIFPVIGKEINLLKTARTLARIAASEAQKQASKRCVAPPKMRSINHRGLNHRAPENTLPAYKYSKAYGFDFVECDVRWTQDNIPVLLHDETINRTGRTASGGIIQDVIYIANVTYQNALNLDFGIHHSQEFSGTKIPTFEQFIALCRNIQLHPYVEIYEEITAEQAKILMDIVRKYGMEDHVTWISFTHNSLLRIIEQNPCSRVGYNVTKNGTQTENVFHMVGLLKTGYNEAFLNMEYTNELLTEYTDKAFELDIPVEVWCPNTIDEILALPVYVSGVTSDKIIASVALYNANIE